MKKFRTFIKIFLITILLFFLYNSLVWNFITKDLMSDNTKTYTNGGLSRLGYMPFMNIKKKNYNTLPGQQIELNEYKGQKIDIITIGDSFSNGGSGGKNAYYQDYILSYQNLSVLNIKMMKYKNEQYLDFIIKFVNSKYLDEIHPKYIIIEAAECAAVQRYSLDTDFNQKLEYKNLKSLSNFLYKIKNKPTNLFEFINNANLKILYNWFLYKLSHNAFASQTYIMNINKSLFSTKYNKKLMFHRFDLDLINFNADDDNINKVNKNLNSLAKKLSKKGIKLYFMPCPDKYTLYSKYIINNPYPESKFFEKLRPLPKKYILIDTKAILSNELEKGEKDIYYADDTHWSYKASEAIFNNVKFK